MATPALNNHELLRGDQENRTSLCKYTFRNRQASQSACRRLTKPVRGEQIFISSTELSVPVKFQVSRRNKSSARSVAGLVPHMDSPARYRVKKKKSLKTFVTHNNSGS